jgi:hypothetical protein
MRNLSTLCHSSSEGFLSTHINRISSFYFACIIAVSWYMMLLSVSHNHDKGKFKKWLLLGETPLKVIENVSFQRMDHCLIASDYLVTLLVSWGYISFSTEVTVMSTTVTPRNRNHLVSRKIHCLPSPMTTATMNEWMNWNKMHLKGEDEHDSWKDSDTTVFDPSQRSHQ